mmetsp:Transcript_8200/g.20319  ORF Transcript_8200/g.20319 Transcript_8200/m.20319 type:complete len:618 (-) Transcript_8200:77-1930(-)
MVDATQADEASAASVDDVLSFWFDGDLDDNYKRKWFPAGDKTGEMQRRVDDAIAERFGATVCAAERGDLDSWRVTSPSSAVALVLLLDQFTRHVYRHHPDRDAKVAAADAAAVLVTERCLATDRRWDLRVPLPHHVFLLMPLRHTQKTVPRLRAALAAMDERRGADEAHAALLGKFQKTTLRCLQDMEGKQHQDGDEILEFHEFTPGDEVMAGMANHPVYQTVERFLRAKLFPADNNGNGNTGSGGNTGGNTGRNESTARSQQSQPRASSSPPPRSIAISLSGGVDSMVLATVLKHLAASLPGARLAVVAMHIDYTNRPGSGAEAAFVEDWCRRHDIVCVVRTIAEVQRGVTPREQYEAESRAIRYGLYKECAAEHGFPAVFVGHHEGDVQENIIANLMRGANLLAVNGMSEEGVVEGVRIWRPMLPHAKDPILEFAHTYGVPYFLDTTPTWSTRGKLRNHLVPLLADMFGDGFLRNLSLLGEDSEQLGDMFERSCMGPFLSGLRLSDAGGYVDCTGFTQQPVLFWSVRCGSCWTGGRCGGGERCGTDGSPSRNKTAPCWWATRWPCSPRSSSRCTGASCVARVFLSTFSRPPPPLPPPLKEGAGERRPCRLLRSPR